MCAVLIQDDQRVQRPAKRWPNADLKNRARRNNNGPMDRVLAL